ncbi:MAG TPA: hypothetical protein VD907_05850 [Verrucomicrobiae bacterium]|nr:hypothetical protein [Verrucomicrobiae bacterium]
MFTGLRRYFLGAVVAFAATLLFSTFGGGDIAHAAGEKYYKNESKGPTTTITGTGGVYGDNVVSFQPAPGRGPHTIYSTKTFLYKVGGENTNVKYPFSDCWYWVTLSIAGNTVHVGTIGVIIPGVKDNIEGIQLDPDDRQQYIDSCNKRATNDPGPGNPAYIGMDRSAPLTIYNSTNPPPANDPNGDGKVDEPAPGTGNNTDDAACSGGLLGWILCPLVQGLVAANGVIVDIIEDLLVLKPLSFDPNDPLYVVWSLIRNIANFIFVLSFLIIIFSQATSMGLSSYGIKTILPRLVAAAILVNVSYFICAAAIDVTNIIGSGISGIVDIGIRAIPDKDEWGTGAEIGMGAFYGVAAGAIIALMFTPLGPAIGLALLGILLAVTGAFATGFVVIVIRHLIITLAVATSALAFLGVLFPGTSGFTKVWWKGSRGMLLLGIILPGLFHGAIFVAKVIAVYGIGGADDGTWVTPIAVVIILAAPAGATPIVLRVAGGIGERFGVWTNNKGKGWVDNIRKRRQDATNLGKGEIASNYDPRATGFGKVVNVGRRIGTGTLGGVTPRSQARARYLRSRMGNTFEAEEIKLATDQLEQLGITNDKEQLVKFIKNDKNKNNQFAKLAAMKQLGEIGASDKLQMIFNQSGTKESNENRLLAAKAIRSSSKIRTEAQPLFYHAAVYANSRQQGKTDYEADKEGQNIRNNKIRENMSQQYLLSQKPDQIELIGTYIGGIKDAGKQAAAKAAFERALDALSVNKNAKTTLTQESRRAIKKSASDLKVTVPKEFDK